MSRARPDRAVGVLALVLAAATVALAGRVAVWRLELEPAEVLATRLGRALVALQGADGAFDPHPADPEIPMVRRTGPHALATYALARLRQTRAASEVPDLDGALGRALDVLVERQQPGGMFGGLPPGVGNPWPAVDATSEGLLALEAGARAEDRGALVAATAALVRAAEYGFRDGWTRVLGALALEAAFLSGALDQAGGALAPLLPVRETVDRVDCGDYALAEAIAGLVLRDGGGLAPRVLAVCLEEPPVWEGQTSDPQGWWMGAWVAARVPGGRPYLDAVAAAVEGALDAPPRGRIPGGWYADGVSQTAAGLLAVLEGIEGGAAEPLR